MVWPCFAAAVQAAFFLYCCRRNRMTIAVGILMRITAEQGKGIKSVLPE
jgi:hypothetical protein